MSINRKSLWTDSEIVLAWISSPSAQWKTFVAHRVGEIQEITSISKWSHVNTNDNPADIISRGQEPSQLLGNEFWWEGPRWLKYDSAEWPSMNKKIDSSTTEECRTINLSSIEQSKLSLLSRYSNLNQLLRVVALCLRFSFNTSHPKDRRTGTLFPEDLARATSCLVRAVQREHWSREISDLTKTGQCSSKSNIFRLRPYLDENNIIRVGGRLKNADHLSFCQKNPMLLPSNNCFTYLIFQDAHENLLHGGPQLMLAHVRQRYWPINGRNITRKISFRCVRCFRLKPVVYQPIMGNLPKHRVEPSRPFSVCGVDFAGPLMIKTSLRRNAALSMGYMCVFVCFSTKVVHIELVGDLTTISFISALRRFCDRRGKCSDIYFDNAKNFVGANRQLVELSNLFNNEENQSKLQNMLSESGIQWHFIPPRSPHIGGLWESAIKSVKHHLFRVLGNAYFTYEELNTILIRVEACLNSRPLTPLSSDPTDLAPLTPGHFLIGDTLTALPEMDVSSIPTNQLTRWRRVMQVSQQLWSRWSREYLSQFQERKRWCDEKGPKVKVGSIVLVKDDNIPPLQWKLGIVQSLHVGKGNDGVPRVATVKTSQGVYHRAIRYLCPLPFEENISNANES